MNFNTDTCIWYQGGSGGFLLYYLYLLSGNFMSGDIYLFDKQDVLKATKLLIKKQFPKYLANDTTKWKTLEYWPDNDFLLKNSTNRHKLYLICNPLFSKSEFVRNASIYKTCRNVLIYTPLDLQIRLAYEKKAYWFTGKSREVFEAPDNTFQYIKSIKKQYALFNGKKVDPVIPKVLKLFPPDDIIELTELLRGSDQFNEDQKQFLKHWLHIQPGKFLRMLNE